jgi:hypothetical protein
MAHLTRDSPLKNRAAFSLAVIENESAATQVVYGRIQHRACLLNRLSRFRQSRFRPVAWIAGFHGPFREIGKIRINGLDPPPVRHENPEGIQIVTLGEIDLKEYQDGLDRFLGCLLSQPTDVPRRASPLAQQRLGEAHVLVRKT